MAFTAAAPQSCVPEDLQLAPLLDDASILDQTFFDPFSLDLPPLQDASQAFRTSTNITDTIQPRPLSPTQHKDVLFSSTTKEPFILTHNHSHPHTYERNKKDVQPSKLKASMPLAEVLNSENLTTIDPMSIFKSTHTPAQTTPYFPRKRRRVEEESPLREDFVHLPRPEPSMGPDQLQQQPRIPPLLQGLHEPPPNAALFPPITGEKPLVDVTHVEDSVPPREEPETLVKSQDPQPAPVETDEEPGSTSRDDKVEPSSSVKPVTGHERNLEPIAQPSPGSTKSRRRRNTANANNDLKSLKRSQSALNRRKWSDDETRDLLAGVQRFGVGRWKEILGCNDYAFDERRTVVDLKDKYRVVKAGVACQADLGSRRRAKRQKKGRERGSEKQDPANTGKELESGQKEGRGAKNKSTLVASNILQNSTESHLTPAASPITSGKDHSRREDHGTPQHNGNDKSGDPALASPRALRKQGQTARQRRPRITFTSEEDDALLAGFSQHGPLWAKIREDSEGGLLMGRLPRDLRDRFRNAWPERYSDRAAKETGDHLGFL